MGATKRARCVCMRNAHKSIKKNNLFVTANKGKVGKVAYIRPQMPFNGVGVIKYCYYFNFGMTDL